MPVINEFVAGQDVDWLSIRWVAGSPWLEFDCWIHLKGKYKFAIWVVTAKVYAVDQFGAATDDPVTEFPKHMGTWRL